MQNRIFLFILYFQFVFSFHLNHFLFKSQIKTTHSIKMISELNIMDKLAAINVELLAKKEEKNILGKKTGGIKPLVRCPLVTVNNKPTVVGKLLERDGCISIPNVLSHETADLLSQFINDELDRSKADITNNIVPFDERFGGVNCRGLQGLFGTRQDLYLPMTNSIVKQATTELINSLKSLLYEIVGPEAMIHEISSIISDPGAPRQVIHTDTAYLPSTQYPNVSMDSLYTFFVALQDIDDNMGQTIFLPSTHTSDIHLLWNVKSQKQKEILLENRFIVKSNLKKGDISIFDSRLLHCGEANTSNKRRILFYLTISRQINWPLPNGLHGSNSIRSKDKWKYQINQFIKE